jgi:hypothetical protein
MTTEYNRKMYDDRTLPNFKFTQDYTVKGILYIKGDEYDIYHFNYDRMIELFEDNIIKEKFHLEITLDI